MLWAKALEMGYHKQWKTFSYHQNVFSSAKSPWPPHHLPPPCRLSLPILSCSSRLAQERRGRKVAVGAPGLFHFPGCLLLRTVFGHFSSPIASFSLRVFLVGEKRSGHGAHCWNSCLSFLHICWTWNIPLNVPYITKHARTSAGTLQGSEDDDTHRWHWLDNDH